MSNISWPRVLAGGVLWAAVYNLVWGVAWFVFMRREWLEATAAIRRSLPWTAIWVVSAALTVPIGVATMAYLAGGPRSVAVPKAAFQASLATWTVMTTGMAVWAWQESLSKRVIALDSTVNFLALLIASLAGQWSQRRPRPAQAQSGPAH